MNKNVDEKKCEKFYSQFTARNARITHVNLSDLPITDDCLLSLIKEHSKSIVHLDISNCTKLSESVLERINQIFTHVVDYSKVNRCITYREEDVSSGEVITETVKSYSCGIIKDTSTGDSFKVTNLPRDNYSLNKLLDVYDNPMYEELKDYKVIESSPTKSVTRDTLFDDITFAKPSSYSGSQSMMSCEFPSMQSEEYSRKIDNFKKTIHIETWQDCPLQSFIIGKSTQLLPDYLDDDISVSLGISNNCMQDSRLTMSYFLSATR